MYCVSCEVRTEFICYIEGSRSPLWPTGQSSWLQIQRSGLDSQRYQIFWEVVGLKRGPLSLVSTVEELLLRKSSGSGLESRDYGRWDPSHWPRGTLYPQKFALTSPTSGGLSVDTVRSRTKATELFSPRLTLWCPFFLSCAIDTFLLRYTLLVASLAWSNFLLPWRPDRLWNILSLILVPNGYRVPFTLV
jgi:hypothetical protein